MSTVQPSDMDSIVWLNKMDSMTSEWDSTLAHISDPCDISKFFSFDDFNQDQDISEDLDRLFAEPSDVLESENAPPAGPQLLSNSVSSAFTDAPGSLASHLPSPQGRDHSLQSEAEQLELSPPLAQVNVANPPKVGLQIKEDGRGSIPKLTVMHGRQLNLDMNDPIVLDLYRQLVIFQSNFATPYIMFRVVDHLKQDILHALSRKLGLEYEYSLHQQQVRISRTPTTSDLDFLGLQHASTLSNIPRLPETPPNETLLPPQETHGGLTGSSGSEIYTNETIWNDVLIGEDQNPESSETNLDFGLHVAIEDDKAFNLVCPVWKPEGMKHHHGRSSNEVLEAPFADAPLEVGSVASIGNFYSSLEQTGTTDGDTSRKNSNSSIKCKNSLSAPHLTGQASFSKQKTLPAKNFDARGSKNYFPRCDYTENQLTSSKNGETSPDRVDHGFTFIVDPSAASQKSSTLVEKCQRSAIPKSSSAIKFQACWKCKSTRKRCDAETPCTCCRKGDLGSIWKIIGCRRGTLETQMPRAILCPTRTTAGDQSWILSNTMKLSARWNRIDFEDVILPQGVGPGRRHTCFSRQAPDLNPRESRSSLQTLQQEIQELIWTMKRKSNKHCFQLLEEGGLYGLRFSTLMDSSVLAFANSPNNIVVAKAFECLRATLYFLTTQAYALEVPSHKDCATTLCLDQPSQDLENHLKQYVNELSREIFRKKNLRGDRGWWLPTFYSLCVQSYVRKILDRLQASSVVKKIIPEITYLHLAVYLFEAVSSGFDPILGNQDPSDTPSSIIEPRFIEIMQVNGHTKTPYGLLRRKEYAKTSYCYLKYIFSIRGGRKLSSPNLGQKLGWYCGAGTGLALEPITDIPLHTTAESPERDPVNFQAMDSDEIDMETLLMTDDTLTAHIASSDRSPTTLSRTGKKHTESDIFSSNESEATWNLIGRLQSNLMQQSKLDAHESILSVVDTPGFVNSVEELEHTINSLLDFATSQIFPLWLRGCVRYNFVQESSYHTTQNNVERLRFFKYNNSRRIKRAHRLVVDLPVPAFPLRNSELGSLYGICIHHIIHGFFHILPKHSNGTHEKPFLAIVHNMNAWILDGGLGRTGIEVPLTCNLITSTRFLRD